MIEREIPGVEKLSEGDIQAAALTSVRALKEIEPG